MKSISKYARKEILIVIMIIVAMGFLVRTGLFNPERLRGLLTDLGIIAPIAFISLCALMIPAFAPPVLFVGVGAIGFGEASGGFYSLLGMTIGACIAFLLGRYSISNFSTSLKKGRFKKLDEWMLSNQTVCLLSLRLIFFSSPMLNYGSSMTGIKLRNYALGTFLGLIPRTFLLSYLFELFTKVSSLREVLTNPFVLSLPMVRIIGVLLLIAITKGTGRDVV